MLEEVVARWVLAVFAPHHPATMFIAASAAVAFLTWGWARAGQEVAKFVATLCKTIDILRTAFKSSRK